MVRGSRVGLSVVVRVTAVLVLLLPVVVVVVKEEVGGDRGSGWLDLGLEGIVQLVSFVFFA